MTEAAPVLRRRSRLQAQRFRLRRDGLGVRIPVALARSMLCAALLIALSGHDPLQAFAAIIQGAVGTRHGIGASLNRPI